VVSAGCGWGDPARFSVLLRDGEQSGIGEVGENRLSALRHVADAVGHGDIVAIRRLERQVIADLFNREALIRTDRRGQGGQCIDRLAPSVTRRDIVRLYPRVSYI